MEKEKEDRWASKDYRDGWFAGRSRGRSEAKTTTHRKQKLRKIVYVLSALFGFWFREVLVLLWKLFHSSL